MELKSFGEFTNEKKEMPDLGETVAFEDELKVKNERNGKMVKIEPNEEFEVIEVSGLTMKLVNKDILFYISKGEFDKLGGYLV